MGHHLLDSTTLQLQPPASASPPPRPAERADTSLSSRNTKPSTASKRSREASTKSTGPSPEEMPRKSPLPSWPKLTRPKLQRKWPAVDLAVPFTPSAPTFPLPEHPNLSESTEQLK